MMVLRYVVLALTLFLWCAPGEAQVGGLPTRRDAWGCDLDKCIAYCTKIAGKRCALYCDKRLIVKRTAGVCK